MPFNLPTWAVVVIFIFHGCWTGALLGTWLVWRRDNRVTGAKRCSTGRAPTGKPVSDGGSIPPASTGEEA